MDDDEKPVFGGPLADWLRKLHEWLFNQPNAPTYENQKFLCDSCKYNFGTYCNRSERPNATKCSDYKKQ